MRPNEPEPRPISEEQRAGAPSDNTTLQHVLERLASDGWCSQLWVVDSPDDAPTEVQCGTCRSRIAPGELHVHSLRRLEGASDPDDMLALLATTCPRCEARGVLVLRYGPEAGVHDGEVLLHVAAQRGAIEEVGG